MNPDRRQTLRRLQRAAFYAGFAGVALAEPVQAFSFFREAVRKPAASQFGFGPRESAKGAYTVYLRPREVLQLHKPLAVRMLVLDATGLPVEGARIAVDGGMPEHAHGLPTQPRVERSLGGGMYDIEGLQFSRGGWWELKLAIESDRGADQVTFNIPL